MKKSVNPPLYPPNSLKPVLFYASFPYGSEDYDNIVQCWNQGIDARLEALTEHNSNFTIKPERFVTRLHIDIFTENAMQILIRRLLDLETESAENLADNIVEVHYGMEALP